MADVELAGQPVDARALQDAETMLRHLCDVAGEEEGTVPSKFVAAHLAVRDAAQRAGGTEK